MCDLICDVFEAAILVKSTHLIKSCLEARKEKKIWKYKKFLRKSQSKRSFRHRIHTLPRRDDAR